MKCAPLSPGHRFGIAGIPWDGSVTNRSGTRMGPQAIRDASHMIADDDHPVFGTELLPVVGDAGDIPIPNTSLVAMRAVVEKEAANLIGKHHMAWLGGDHSITLSLLRAYRQHFGRPLAVVHLDAHCDTWPDHYGEASGHGSWVLEAIQEGLVLPNCFTQIGIRSPAVREAREYVQEHGGQIFTGCDLRGLASPAQLAPILQSIGQRLEAHDQPPLYVSFDIDCLDPAYAPGTGTPEPGGLSINQALTLIEGLAAFPSVGMDCVEVSPPYDHSQITSLAAAHLVWTYLCGQRALHPQSE